MTGEKVFSCRQTTSKDVTRMNDDLHRGNVISNNTHCYCQCQFPESMRSLQRSFPLVCIIPAQKFSFVCDGSVGLIVKQGQWECNEPDDNKHCHRARTHVIVAQPLGVLGGGNAHRRANTSVRFALKYASRSGRLSRVSAE